MKLSGNIDECVCDKRESIVWTQMTKEKSIIHSSSNGIMKSTEYYAPIYTSMWRFSNAIRNFSRIIFSRCLIVILSVWRKKKQRTIENLILCYYILIIRLLKLILSTVLPLCRASQLSLIRWVLLLLPLPSPLMFASHLLFFPFTSLLIKQTQLRIVCVSVSTQNPREGAYFFPLNVKRKIIFTYFVNFFCLTISGIVCIHVRLL